SRSPLSRCRHTRPLPPVQGSLPPIDPELDLTPGRPLYPARPEKAPMTDRTLAYAAPTQAAPLTGRRVFFTLIVTASMAGLVWLLAFALTAGGFGVVDFILV